MTRGFKKFVLRTLLALLPVAVYVALYLVLDPFRVIRPYDGVAIPAGDTLHRIPNMRYIALEGFKVYNPREHYDSFIFGSSISTNFFAADWKKHLPDSASVYHFTAAAQPLTGIRDELRWLVSHDVPVRHALLVIEEEMLRRPKRYNEMPFVPHYEVSPEINRLQFHMAHFNAYRDFEMFLYSIYPPLTLNHLIADNKVALAPSRRDEVLNEDYCTKEDSLLKADPEAFFSQSSLSWLKTIPVFPDPVPLSINASGEAVLRDIAAVLQEHHVDYVVILPPRYMCPALSEFDHALLYEIFGESHVNDFTGDGVLVHDLNSYYDGVHVIASRCAELIDRSYERHGTEN